jgi:hypothetical protein
MFCFQCLRDDTPIEGGDIAFRAVHALYRSADPSSITIEILYPSDEIEYTGREMTPKYRKSEISKECQHQQSETYPQKEY